MLQASVTKHSVVLSYPVPDHLVEQPRETEEDSVGMRWGGGGGA